MRILFFLFLLFPCRLLAQVKPACADLSEAECREEFVRANTPNPKKIDPASPVLQPIRDALVSAEAAAKQAKTLADDIEDMEKALSGAQSRDPGLPPATVENIIASRKLLADAVKKKYEFRNLAIERTIHIYGLEPHVKVAPAHPRDLPGAIDVKPWNPRYSENQGLDKDGHGRLKTNDEKLDLARRAGLPAGSKMDLDGGTHRDSGAIGLFPHAFEKPELLAAVILHETVHWLDVAASGRQVGPYESFVSEQKAYGTVIGQATTLGLTNDYVKSMARLQARYARQAPQAVGLTWGQVERNHSDWMFNEVPEPTDGDAVMGHPEQTKVQGEEDFLGSWQREAENISRKAQAALQEAEKAARLERERREEAARLAQPRVATRREMDELAAKCGYQLIDDSRWELSPEGRYRAGGENITGFKDDRHHHYFKRSFWTRIDLGDLELAFLISRACDDMQLYPGLPAPPPAKACNDSARIFRARATEPGSGDKFSYLFDESRLRPACVTNAISNADVITDAASFNRVLAEFQAPLRKNRDSELKRDRRDREREERDRRREERESANGGHGGNEGQRSSPDHDEVWRRVAPIIGR